MYGIYLLFFFIIKFDILYNSRLVLETLANNNRFNIIIVEYKFFTIIELLSI